MDALSGRWRINMKTIRQSAILDIIAKKDIETQEDLAEELGNIGIAVTQATVSRDIKELRLIKVLTPNTKSYKYATAEHAEHGLSDRFMRILSDSVLSITFANNLIVIRTLSGSANVCAEAIDSMKWTEILGTLAGDNTILLIIKNNDEVNLVIERINGLMK